jgi:hypothetical protein
VRERGRVALRTRAREHEVDDRERVDLVRAGVPREMGGEHAVGDPEGRQRGAGGRDLGEKGVAHEEDKGNLRRRWGTSTRTRSSSSSSIG